MKSTRDSKAAVRAEIGQELRAALAVQAETGEVLNEALVDGFIDKVALGIAERESASDMHAEQAHQRCVTAAENRLVVVLTSIVFGTPVTAWLWHQEGVEAAAGTWAGIFLLNGVFAMASTSDRKQPNRTRGL